MERARKKSDAVARRGAALRSAGNVDASTLTVENKTILAGYALVGLGLVDHGPVQAHIELAVRLGQHLPAADRRLIAAEILAQLGFAADGDEGEPRHVEQQVAMVA